MPTWQWLIFPLLLSFATGGIVVFLWFRSTLTVPKTLNPLPFSLKNLKHIDHARLSQVDRLAGNLGFIKRIEYSITDSHVKKYVRFYDGFEDTSLFVEYHRAGRRRSSEMVEFLTLFEEGRSLATRNFKYLWPEMALAGETAREFPGNGDIEWLFTRHQNFLAEAKKQGCVIRSIKSQSIFNLVQARHQMRLENLARQKLLALHGTLYRPTGQLMWRRYKNRVENSILF